MSHFKEVCQHGIVMRQCRCPAPDKSIRIVPCKCDERKYYHGKGIPAPMLHEQDA